MKRIRIFDEYNQLKELCNSINETFPIELKKLIFSYLSVFDLIQYKKSSKSMYKFINSLSRTIVLLDANPIQLLKFIRASRGKLPICCEYEKMFHKKKCDSLYCEKLFCEYGGKKCYKCNIFLCNHCSKNELYNCKCSKHCKNLLCGNNSFSCQDCYTLLCKINYTCKCCKKSLCFECVNVDEVYNNKYCFLCFLNPIKLKKK